MYLVYLAYCFIFWKKPIFYVEFWVLIWWTFLKSTYKSWFCLMWPLLYQPYRYRVDFLKNFHHPLVCIKPFRYCISWPSGLGRNDLSHAFHRFIGREEQFSRVHKTVATTSTVRGCITIIRLLYSFDVVNGLLLRSFIIPAVSLYVSILCHKHL